jgi:hypothetical protein
VIDGAWVTARSTLGHDPKVFPAPPGKPLPYVICGKSNESSDAVRNKELFLRRDPFRTPAFGVLHKLGLKVIKPFAGFVSMTRRKLH